MIRCHSSRVTAVLGPVSASSGSRLLPLVYGQLCSLHGGELQQQERRPSQGTLDTARQLAERQARELDSFLAGINSGLEQPPADPAAHGRLTHDTKLSPELMAEVASVLGRLKESLRESSNTEQSSRTAGLLCLIDRLHTELKATSPSSVPPPVPPRRRLMRRYNRPHTTTITRDELSNIRKTMQETRQQLRQQQEQNNDALNCNMTQPPTATISNSPHSARPLIGRLNSIGFDGTNSNTFPQPYRIHQPNFSRPTPAPRAVDRQVPNPTPHQGRGRHGRPYTIGGSDEDYAAIRVALEAAITPSPLSINPLTSENNGIPITHPSMSIVHQNGDYEENLVPHTARIHEARRQFAHSSKPPIHHHKDQIRSNTLPRPGGSRSNSQSPRPSLTAVLAKQRTQDYLDDNISRDEFIENSLANHRKTKLDNVTKTISEKQPAIPSANGLSSSQPPVETQYTCSIITQETQTAELPTERSQSVFEQEVLSAPTAGNQPIWAKQTKPQGRLSLKPPDSEESVHPPWVRHPSPEASTQPPWLRKGRSDLKPSNSPKNIEYLGESAYDRSSQNHCQLPSQETDMPKTKAPHSQHAVTQPSQAQSTDLPADTSSLVSSQHLPWSKSDCRPPPRSPGAPTVTNIFASASDAAHPTSPRLSRLEKTRSLYTDDKLPVESRPQPLQQRQLALQRLQPAMSSDENKVPRRALERSKSEEQIGLRARNMFGSKRYQQAINTNQIQQKNQEKAFRDGASPLHHRQNSIGGTQGDATSFNPQIANSLRSQSIPHLKSYPPAQMAAHVPSGPQFPGTQAPSGLHNPTLKMLPTRNVSSTEYRSAFARTGNFGIHAHPSLMVGSAGCQSTAHKPSADTEQARGPVWAQDAGTVHGKVKQRAATLDTVPASEDYIPPMPKANDSRRHSSDTGMEGKVYHGSSRLSQLVSANVQHQFHDQSSLGHLANAPDPNSLPPATLSATTQPSTLPPRSPRPVPARAELKESIPMSASRSSNFQTSAPGLQRSSSSDMLRFGVTTKPFEARLDAASAKQKQKRLQNFLQERKAQKDNEQLARSFEDLLDDLDEDELAAVSSSGGSGKSGAATRSAPMLAKSATVGDLRSGRDSSMFPPAQQRRAQPQPATRAGMPPSNRASNAQVFYKKPPPPETGVTHHIRDAISSTDHRNKIPDDTLDLVKKYFAKEGM